MYAIGGGQLQNFVTKKTFAKMFIKQIAMEVVTVEFEKFVYRQEVYFKD